MRASKNMMNYAHTILVEAGFEDWIVSKNQEELIISDPETPYIHRYMSFFPSSTDVCNKRRLFHMPQHTHPHIIYTTRNKKNVYTHTTR